MLEQVREGVSKTQQRVEGFLAVVIGKVTPIDDSHSATGNLAALIQITADDRRDATIPDSPGDAGSSISFGLLKAAQANSNITLLPDQSCIDLITGRNQEHFSGSGRVWGAYALDQAVHSGYRRIRPVT